MTPDIHAARSFPRSLCNAGHTGRLRSSVKQIEELIVEPKNVEQPLANIKIAADKDLLVRSAFYDDAVQKALITPLWSRTNVLDDSSGRGIRLRETSQRGWPDGTSLSSRFARSLRRSCIRVIDRFNASSALLILHSLPVGSPA